MRLATEALRRARARGFERIELEVYASNRAAKTLYDRLGFETEGVKRRGRKLDGHYDDVVLMALFLQEPRDGRDVGVAGGVTVTPGVAPASHQGKREETP